MKEQLRFDGQVAVITGAGGGLGRAYAHFFASRGAKVVVNDFGVSSSGEGSDSKAADVVVHEIKINGGTAVADYNSVEDGSKIIDTALENFGRIDILVNNAGILRDRSFARTSDTDWDLVHRVHLRGSFLVTRAAFPHMKNQKYGRIIMTSSVAGIYGNFGQANYSAAKMGLLGLSNTVAVEGQKYNIHCNTIAPMSGTRLTQGILPPDLFQELKPELIAPLVLWLCHKDCKETGGLFEAAGGWFGKYRWEHSRGFTCRNSLMEEVTPESVRDNWDKISSFIDPHYVTTNGEAAGLLAMVLEDLKGKNTQIVPAVTSANRSGPLALVGLTSKGAMSFTYDTKDVILYALGVGASTKDKDGLKFLYEGDEKFSVLPTFAVIPVIVVVFEFLSAVREWKFDLTKLLHGEQYIELLQPIPPFATLSTDIKITDVLDKGSGVVIVIDTETFNERRTLLFKNQLSIFIVGDGGFGGPRGSAKVIPLAKHPQREPDVIDTFTTSIDQAALYRLSGDRNPLHIDPNFAALGGFDQPILHGLCSYGIAARAVLRHFCDNDVARFKAIKSRFVKPVIPGQTLVTSMWKEGTRVYFETNVAENSSVCLSGGYVDISDSAIPGITGTGSELECDRLLASFAKKAADLPPLLEKGLILWNITHGDKIVSQWTFDLYDTLKIYKGCPAGGRAPLSTVTISEEDFLSLLKGRVIPQKLFLSGKMKVAGLGPNFRTLISLISTKANL